ncbi:uncharacterized protein BYT42DRAFT_573983 [Radiomyces spectabilis]|uniref:uncharacterized protein n=1 Tax=Radiomyces spectabilis TaxID=64574 RepID=UPI00221EE335|nr:uncharacterized protein BYT42DRAFT_573983 [Radiomyces spectabilis]KAI8376260.1 hypothetical protein BYT42DRAFT_573983 [Radiomyces spectabilis]
MRIPFFNKQNKDDASNEKEAVQPELTESLSPVNSLPEGSQAQPPMQHQGAVPKGFANDTMRTTNRPDVMYGFDDPMCRTLGPVRSTDPTNTGA